LSLGSDLIRLRRERATSTLLWLVAYTGWRRKCGLEGKVTTKATQIHRGRRHFPAQLNSHQCQIYMQKRLGAAAVGEGNWRTPLPYPREENFAIKVTPFHF